MKHIISIGLLLALGCGSAQEQDPVDTDTDGDEIELGTSDSGGLATIQQDVHTILNNSNETWGTNAIAPFEKCKNNGSTSQDCRFVMPYSISGGFGAPTRYTVNNRGGFSSQDAALVGPIMQGVASHMTSELYSSQIQTPIVIDYNGPTGFSALNVKGGTVSGNAGGNRTDNYFTLSTSGCVTLSEPSSLPGTYRKCNVIEATVDVPKLRANFTNQTHFSRALTQVIAKAILTGLGAGRTGSNYTVRDIYPLAATLNANYLTTGERDQLRCLGYSWQISQTTFEVASQSSCGPAM
jgi:hypothetical protein